MSDAMRLMSEVQRLLRRLLPEMHKDNREALALMITGILKGGTVQFRKIADEVYWRAKKASLEKRFERLVQNERVVVEATFLPFLELVLQGLSGERLILTIDTTKVARKCICVMIAVIYKSRALPLAWVVYRGSKGHSTAETQLALLKTVADLLPADREVLLLGDGEFDSKGVIDWLLNTAHWHFVCRTACETKICWQGRWVHVQDLVKHLGVEPAQESFWREILFTESGQIGPLNLWVAWSVKDNCHLFFVTTLPTAQQAQQSYRKRFTIETLFSDHKSRGFDLARSRLSRPERVSRLLLATAIAYIFTIFLGVALIFAGPVPELVRSKPYYDSLFQLGLTYLKHLLNACLDFPQLGPFPPPASFDHPVYAPRRLTSCYSC